MDLRLDFPAHHCTMFGCDNEISANIFNRTGKGFASRISLYNCIEFILVESFDNVLTDNAL